MSDAAPQQAAPLVVNLQYIRDLSFEAPGAPAIFSSLTGQPQVRINLDVQARRLEENQPQFEVSLVIRVEAHEMLGESEQGRTVFLADLTYAGMFTLSGIPADQMEPVLLIECPRLLFPFARNILADVTRDGGFPPVLLQPIDFVALWHSRRAAEQQAAQGPVGHA